MNKKNLILIGNQNVGKSSIFNALTGLKQKTSNYPGVTVEEKKGSYTYEDDKYIVTDLPGTYSLYPTSRDEDVVYNSIISQTKQQNAVFIYVADATNIERNLLFFSQIMDLGLPIIIVITMNDLAVKKGIELNQEKLSELLNKITVIKLEKYDSKNILKIKKAIAETEIHKSKKGFIDLNDYVKMPFCEIIRKKSKKYPYMMLCQLLKEKGSLNIDNDKEYKGDEDNKINVQWVESRGKIQKNELAVRYKKLKQILSFCVTRKDGIPESSQYFWDKLLTHKVWGLGSFLLILALIFQSIFSWSSIPMDLIDSFFAFSSEYILSLVPDNFIVQLIGQGIIPGIGGVMIFVPQITVLFAFLTILEESGYMMRVVFILDRFLQPLGLSGRSIVPLTSGFACAVPAIQSAKSIENWKERLITILVIPFMSCSARLPVYTTIIALMIPSEATLWGVFNLHGVILFLLYLLGVLASLFFSFVLKKSIKSQRKGFLIMEMPDYRFPNFKNISIVIYSKVKPFVLVVGKVIVIFSVILWFLGSYGLKKERHDTKVALKTTSKWEKASDNEKEYMLNSIDLETSYLGWIGKGILPIFKPLGYDWKISIAILTSFAAREIFIGTLATMYSVGEEKQKPLLVKMRNEKTSNGLPIYSTATCLSLLVFYALAMQCVSTLAITKKELGTWKWPVIQFFAFSIIAYVSAYFTFQAFSYL